MSQGTGKHFLHHCFTPNHHPISAKTDSNPSLAVINRFYADGAHITYLIGGIRRYIYLVI